MFVSLVADGPKTAEEKEIFTNWEQEVICWKKQFTEIHRLREMRIYPHIIIDHGKQIYERHGLLSALLQQGMEHANKWDVLTWHRHTSCGGGSVKKVGKLPLCCCLNNFPLLLIMAS